MAPAPILDYYLLKRKTRVFPYFIGVCELFITTLFMFFTTPTWFLNREILGAFESV